MYLFYLVPVTVLLSVIGTYKSALIADDSIVLTGHSSRFYHGSVDKWIGGDTSNFSLQAVTGKISKSNGVAFHKKRDFVILTDAGYNTIFATKVKPEPYATVLIHIGTSSGVGQAAVDWINGNIYWIDRVYGWIALQSVPRSTTVDSLNPNFKNVVDKYLDQPSGLAVHPLKGYLFWTDIGIQPKIERSGLRGSSRQIILWEGLLKPTALCVDVETDRIYWTDSQRGTIEHSDLNGDNRRIIVSQPGSDFYWIDLFRDLLIVNDHEHNTTHQFSTSGVERSAARFKTSVPLYEFVVYSEEKQQNGQGLTSERCDTYGCSQMCFQLSDNVIECDCEDGHTLEQDGKTCTVATRVLQRHMLFTNGTDICAITINTINSFQFLPTQKADCTVVRHNKTIQHFAFDVQNRTIFFTDGKTMYQQDVFEMNSRSLYQSANQITDMDYNWKTHQVVWTEKVAGTIFQLDTTTTDPEAVIVATGLQLPTSIAVDPHNDLLFWFATDDVTSAIRLHKMDSQGTISTISTIHQLSAPTDLEYDRNRNRLVWSDGNSLVSIRVAGTDETELTLKPNKQYRSITVFKEYTILTFEDSFHALQHDGSNEKVFSLDSIRAVSDIHVFADSLQPTDLEPCEKNNGDCDQICLPNGEPPCACKVGYKLMADGKTCTSDMIPNDYFLVTDSLNNEIYQIDRESLEISAINLGMASPVFSTADSADNIYWVDNLDKKVKRMSLEDQSIHVLPVNDLKGTSTIAIDATSGQAYITLEHTILIVKETEVHTVVQNLQGMPRNLKVFPKFGMMFWIETGGITRIAKSNMDGSTIIDVIRSGISSPEDIAIDYQGREIYWCDSALSKIEAVDINSHSRRSVTSKAGLNPVALDIHEDFLYMITENTFNRAISRMRKDGTGFEIVFQSAVVGRLTSLWVYKDMSQSVNAACAVLNGGCSTLCLPRQNGRSCQCSDGDQLLEDKTTCATAPKCAEDVSNVKLDDSCLPYLNQICTFTCEDGYRNTKPSTVAVCLATGKWNITSSICEADKDGSESLPVAVIGGAAGGGILVIVIIIVVIVCLCKRKRPQPHKKFSEQTSVRSARYGQFPVRENGENNPTSNEPNPYDYIERFDEIGEPTQTVEPTATYLELTNVPWEPPPDYVEPITSQNFSTNSVNSPPPSYATSIEQHGQPDQCFGLVNGGYLTASQTGSIAGAPRNDVDAGGGYLSSSRIQ